MLESHDNNISFLELLTAPLAMYTFDIRYCLWCNYIDNQGVLHALVRGSCKRAEVNIATGAIWGEQVTRSNSLVVARVESRANIADGPTRNNFSILQMLGARLPPWTHELWQLGGA